MSQSTDLSDDAILQQLGGDGARAELFRGSFDTLEVKFTGGEVKTALARESSGVGLRVIRDGKLGFVGSRDTSPEGLERLLVNLESSLEVGDAVAFDLPEPQPAPAGADALEEPDAATAALEVADLVAVGKQALAALKERHPKVVYEATVRRSVGQSALRSSRGVTTEDRYTVFSFSVEANRTQDEDVLIDWAYGVGPSRASVDLDALVERLADRLTWSEQTVPFRPGKMPVIFTPSGSLTVWSPVLQALSGKAVMLGTSPLRERVGEQIASPAIRLTDDGLLPGGLGSSAFDDEGVPRRTRHLIEDGVLRGFVHDLETAQATGGAPTGNGERGGATGKPGPGFSNVVLRGGETPWADMLAGVKYGLLVHSVMGMGQGNTLPGNFSNPIDLAFLIEDGQVKGRVKDASIAGNVYTLLSDQLGGLSAEVERVGGSYFLPWLKIDDLNVVGKDSG